MATLNRVLILSVSVGAGHMRAATAVKSAILELNPQAEVTVLDTFRYTNPFWDKMLFNTYIEILKATPLFYGYLYHLAEKERPLSSVAREEFNNVLNKFAAPKLIRFLSMYRPQVVVCTHPFPLGVLDKLKGQGCFTEPVVVTLTDFIVHPFWVSPRVDLFSVAAEELKFSFKEYGIDMGRVCACGIPVDPCFADPVDRLAVQAGLSLNPGKKTVLIVGGSLGMGPLADIVKALGNSSVPCQMIVVTGYNDSLRTKLERMVPGLSNPVKVLGFVSNMHELMSVSDFMIGKAGGLTCAEALAKGLPVFIVDPIPGQEVRNAEFLSGAGAALLMSSVKELVQKVEEYISEPWRLQEMSVVAARLGKPRAARSIAGMIESLVGSDCKLKIGNWKF
ncbi:MAG TPA: galactosyldiacylglycerol synthase [Desulfotomaculum sp.]|nr:galactosyldiacylglycerol synthase [Desulfotomaculum sp.]